MDIFKTDGYTQDELNELNDGLLEEFTLDDGYDSEVQNIIDGLEYSF